MSRILFGAAAGGEIFSLSHQNLEDDGTAVCIRAITGTWAPNGWWGTALWRTVTVNVSANVGATIRVTPIVDGAVQDGSEGPDCRVSFTLTAPAAGQRAERRSIVGLSRPVTMNGTDYGKVGLRGTFLAFLVETLGVLDVSNGETNPDFRVEALSVAVQPQYRTTQVVNA